jgi:putative nucleotidyltransferase with HDIG domain
MKSLPLKARLYILILSTAAVILMAVSLVLVPRSTLIALEILIFTLAICVTDFYPIVLPREGNAEITISCALKTTAAIIFGPHVTIIVTLFGTILAEMMLHRSWYKALFNAAEMTLTFASMSVVYELLYDGFRTPFHSFQNAGAVGAMVLTYYLINTGLVTTIVTLTTNASFVHIWKACLRDTFWNNLTIIPLGAVVAALWLYQPWSVFALVLPMIAVRQSFQFIADLQRQTREALVSMADAIDQRDPSTYQHSQRVAIIAEAIGTELQLPEEELETIRMAARLHDLGKIGMSNALLYKPGRFDDAEQAEFRRHPLISAELVKSFRLFTEGQSLILYHHERYDGGGYPIGLKGEDIPLGSRILAVADSLDAMTSARVYRAPLSLKEGVAEVQKHSGTQFDPAGVDALLRAVERWGGKLPWPDDGKVRDNPIPKANQVQQDIPCLKVAPTSSKINV